MGAIGRVIGYIFTKLIKGMVSGMKEKLSDVNTVAVAATCMPEGSRSDYLLIVPIADNIGLDEGIGVIPSEHGHLVLCLAEWASEKELDKAGIKKVYLDGKALNGIKAWLDEHIESSISTTFKEINFPRNIIG